MKIASSGNVEVPSYLCLIQQGYEVSFVDNDEGRMYIARGHNIEFVAASMLELLGLISIVSLRGNNWQASDKEIEAFIKKFE
jgi:hypothetical protein